MRHVFTEGYLTPEGREIINPAVEQKSARTPKTSARHAKIGARVARYVSEGDWLDINFWQRLAFTAAEWRFSAVGTDLNDESVERLSKFG